MEAFLINISSFPTIIFSVALAAVIGFWLLSFFGLFDFEMFDADVDMDIEVDGEIGEIGGIAGLLTTLGLTGVPITVVISLLVLNGWFICYFASLLIPTFPAIIGLLQGLINIAILVVSFLVSIPITATLIKPLRPLFKKSNQEPISRSLIGQSCRIRSSRADNDFGEAECIHNGASLIIKVRTSGNARFKTGERAVLIEHRKESDTFLVVSEKEFTDQMDA